MKVRTKEEMREYQRRRRGSVTPVVTPFFVTPVTPINVTPDVTPCLGCLERDLQIKKLTMRVAFLEKSMERYVALDSSQKSIYRLGPEFRECR